MNWKKKLAKNLRSVLPKTQSQLVPIAIFVLVVIGSYLLGLDSNESQLPSTTYNNKHLVTRVIDGDTIELESGKKVRYIGIDTPETKHPNQEVECYGQEATEKNWALVLNKQVRLEKDVSNTDRYGRLLRYVYIDGQMVNELLVREGYAVASPYPPDVKYQSRLQGAEQLAREENKGLWGAACQ